MCTWMSWDAPAAEAGGGREGRGGHDPDVGQGQGHVQPGPAAAQQSHVFVEGQGCQQVAGHAHHA